jgi:hypothetical protein
MKLRKSLFTLRNSFNNRLYYTINAYTNIVSSGIKLQIKLFPTYLCPSTTWRSYCEYYSYTKRQAIAYYYYYYYYNCYYYYCNFYGLGPKTCSALEIFLKSWIRADSWGAPWTSCEPIVKPWQRSVRSMALIFSNRQERSAFFHNSSCFPQHFSLSCKFSRSTRHEV